MLESMERGDLPFKRVGVFGAGTPQGIELMRVISIHPMLKLAFAADAFLSGTSVRDRFPGLAINVRESFVDLNSDLVAEADLVICALDDLDAGELVPQIIERYPETKLIDCSLWFRPGDRDLFERMAGTRHPAPHVRERFTYGYSDRELAEIAAATQVSLPSALAQSLLIALEPLAREELLRGSVTASAVVGAPDARALPNASISPDLRAHRPLSHPAALEAQTWLAREAEAPFTINLVPLAHPGVRGVYATIFVPLSDQLTLGSVDALYRRFYDNAIFVRQLGEAPELNGVLGSNRAHFSIRIADNVLAANVALDTLGRGGAMHAIELANIMLRLPEEAGLLFPGQSQ